MGWRAESMMRRTQRGEKMGEQRRERKGWTTPRRRVKRGEAEVEVVEVEVVEEEGMEVV